MVEEGSDFPTPHHNGDCNDDHLILLVEVNLEDWFFFYHGGQQVNLTWHFLGLPSSLQLIKSVV